MATEQRSATPGQLSRVQLELLDPRKEREFFSLTFTEDGQLVAADNCPNEKKKTLCVFRQDGRMLRTVEAADYLFIAGIAITDEGDFILIDFHSNAIIVFPPEGGESKNRLFTEHELYGPNAIVFHEGLAFVTESKANRVSVFSKDGAFKYSFGATGDRPGQFNWPSRLCLGPDARLYVTDMNNHRVQVFTKAGEFVRQFGREWLRRPLGIAATADGRIVVASGDANKISFFDGRSGKCVLEVTRAGLNYPVDVKVGPDGSIYVADSGNRRIVKF